MLQFNNDRFIPDRKRLFTINNNLNDLYQPKSRYICGQPFKILDASELNNQENLFQIDWSVKNTTYYNEFRVMID